MTRRPQAGEIEVESWRLLELDRLLERVAERCEGELGRREARAARPARDPQEARARLDETEEALGLLEAPEEVPRLPAGDPLAVLDRALDEGRPLTARELAALLEFVSSAREIVRFFRSTDGTPALLRLARGVADLADLGLRLERTVDRSGVLLDSASPRLANLRVESRDRREEVRRLAERAARRPEVRALLREPRPVVRGGRFVLAVKAAARGQVPGVYVDRSASGETAYIEPEAVVDAQRHWLDLERDAAREEARILWEVSREVFERRGDIEASASAVGRIDFAFARARLARDLGAVRPEIAPCGEPMRLPGARHPLLLDLALREGGSLEEARRRVVPFTVTIGEAYDLLVLTGPNTGGKTATLKAVGLLPLAARLGCFLPTEGKAIIPIHPGIFADVGDAQDLERSLSTFSGHIGRVARMLASARPGSLLLLDELGTGTDPLEGEALAEALLDAICTRRLLCVATTHLGRLKRFASSRPRAANASMEFDAVTLRPTYRLHVGIPGASHALEIAERLGVERAIVEAARRRLSEEEEGSTSLNLRGVDEARAEAERRLERARKVEGEAQDMLAEARRRADEAERLREHARLEAEAAWEERMAAFAREIEPARRELLGLGGRAARAASAVLEALRKALQGGGLAERRRRFLRKLRVGDAVYLPRHRRLGRVRRVMAREGRVEIDVGAMSLTVDVDEVAPADAAAFLLSSGGRSR